jgi:transposase-like protein
MNAPKVGVGDGAMGFWAAMDEVYQTARQQRCCQHKTMNVLNCLPKLSQPKAKAAIHNIWQAETKEDAEKRSTSLRNTGRISAPEIQLNRPSPRSAIAPRAAYHAKACWT